MITIILASSAFIAAMIAAGLWYLSGSIDYRLSQPTKMLDGTTEDVPYTKAPATWVKVLHKSFTASGKINRMAAIFTAVSVLLSSASSVAGAFHL